LLFPKLPDGPVEVIPDHERSSFDAYLWRPASRPASSRGRPPGLLLLSS
jgi:hypothetical protein